MTADAHGARPRWAVAAVVSVVAVLLVAAAVAALVGGGDSSDPEGRATPAEPTRNAAGDAAAATGAMGAQALVSKANVWHAANPRTPAATHDPVPLDPDVDRDCPPIQLVPFDQELPEGHVSISYADDPAGQKALVPVGTSGIHRCKDLKAFVEAPAHRGKAPTVTVATRTALFCGDFGGGPHDRATRAEVPWSDKDPYNTQGEEFENRPERCLRDRIVPPWGPTGDAQPLNPSPEWQVMGVTDALQRRGRCIGCDFSGMDLRGVRWGGDYVFITRSTFDGARIEDLTLSQAVLITNTSMRGATLRHVVLQAPHMRANAINLDLRPAEDGTPSVLDGVVLPDEVSTVALDGAMLRDIVFPWGADCLTMRNTAVLSTLGASLTNMLDLSTLGDANGELTCEEPFRGSAVSLSNLRGYGELSNTLRDLHATQSPADWRDTYEDTAPRMPRLQGSYLYVDPTEVGAVKDLQLFALDLRDVHLIGATADLSGINLGLADLSGVNLDRQDFGTNAVLAGANLTDASFEGARLVGTDLSGARIEHTSFKGAELAGALFSNVVDPSAAPVTTDERKRAPDFRGAHAANAQFDQAHGLAGADFTGAVLRGAAFDGATLTYAVFEGADATSSTFVGASMEGVDFSHATCVNCNLSKARVGQLTIDSGKDGKFYVRSTFDGAQFSGANLLDIEGTGADLTGLATGDAPPDQWTYPTTPFETASGVPLAATSFPPAAQTTGVEKCPDGSVPNGTSGCTNHWDLTDAPPVPTCLGAASFACAPKIEPYWTDLSAGVRAVLVAHQVGTDVWVVAREDGSVQVREGKKAVADSTADKSWPTGGRPTALIPADDGSFYLSDAATVSKVTLDPTTLKPTGVRVAGNGGGGEFGDGRPATEAGFTAISGLALDPAGQLLIADATAERIRVLAGDGIVRPVEVQGTTKLGSPGGLAVDRAGHVYVAVPRDHQIKQLTFVTPTPGGAPVAVKVSAFAGNGNAGYDNAIGTSPTAALPFGKLAKATATPFGMPSNVTVLYQTTASEAANGLPMTLLVADRDNAVLRPINSSASPNPHAVLRPLAGVPAGGGPGLGDALGSVDSAAVSPDGSQVIVIDAQRGRAYRITFPNTSKPAS